MKYQKAWRWLAQRIQRWPCIIAQQVQQQNGAIRAGQAVHRPLDQRSTTEVLQGIGEVTKEPTDTARVERLQAIMPVVQCPVIKKQGIKTSKHLQQTVGNVGKVHWLIGTCLSSCTRVSRASVPNLLAFSALRISLLNQADFTHRGRERKKHWTEQRTKLQNGKNPRQHWNVGNHSTSPQLAPQEHVALVMGHH